MGWNLLHHRNTWCAHFLFDGYACRNPRSWCMSARAKNVVLKTIIFVNGAKRGKETALPVRKVPYALFFATICAFATRKRICHRHSEIFFVLEPWKSAHSGFPLCGRKSATIFKAIAWFQRYLLALWKTGFVRKKAICAEKQNLLAQNLAPSTRHYSRHLKTVSRVTFRWKHFKPAFFNLTGRSVKLCLLF